MIDESPRAPRIWLCALVLWMAVLNGCAVVRVSQTHANEADFALRSDVLNNGRLSADASANLAIAGVALENCQREPEPCSAQLQLALPVEAWLATIAEVRTLRLQAVARPKEMQMAPEVAAHEAIDVARWAYAYLFMTPRTPEQRAFESRQQRVLRLYNHAVETAAQSLFEVSRLRGQPIQAIGRIHNLDLHLVVHGFDQSDGSAPEALLASSTLGFDNLRAIFRRDGFGTSLVAVFPRQAETAKNPVQTMPVAVDDTANSDAGRLAASADIAALPLRDPPYRDTRYLSVTSTLKFEGESLAQVLATENVQLNVYNPYRFDHETVAGRTVPLAANFSAAYGVWLARAELARLSLSSLLRPRQTHPFDPRVYLGQPYDPDKRVVILVHGLASSPEAWVNLANEVLGEEELRQEYQLWQVFYPTNLGILTSRARIDEALRTTFAHFDPEGDDRASRNAVLVGHSMGGVISRLLISDSGQQVLERSLDWLPPEQARVLAQEPRMRELAVFSPLPNIGRAVFLAAPQRGADLNDAWPIRLVRRAIRLPLEVVKDASDLLKRHQVDEQQLQQVGFRNGRPATGPDDLSPGSLFMHATADLPVAPGVPYHTIVGVRDSSVPLAQSSDGAVPYASAHMPGAVSEKAISPSGHSVQETPGAILELRRILRLDMEADKTRSGAVSASP